MGPDLNGPRVPNWTHAGEYYEHQAQVLGREDLKDRSIPEGSWRYASVGDTRRDGSAYGEAVGRWLGDYAAWQWFVTLTLGRDVDDGFSQPGVGTARRALRSLLVLSRATAVVAVFEQHRDGVPHVHALLGGCAAINGRTAEDYFRKAHGLARWKIFDHHGNAPKYIGKYLTKAAVEMYMSKEGPWEYEKLRGTTMGGLRV